MSKQLILIGCGGFGREVLWVCRRAGMEVIGACDDAASLRGGVLDDVPILGSIEEAVERVAPGVGFHIAIGDNRRRSEVAQRAVAAGWQALSVVDPTAIVAPNTQIGAGSYIGISAVVSGGARLGRHVLVNFQATVGHDVVVGDYGQICPGARISGAVCLGTGAFVGSNGVVIPLRKIGAWAAVGAGAVALRDLADGEQLVRLR